MTSDIYIGPFGLPADVNRSKRVSKGNMMAESPTVERHKEQSRDAFGLKPVTTSMAGKTVENPTGIHPVEFKILVKLDPVQGVTAGGIHLPDNRKERDQMAETFATLIEVGGNAFTEPQWEGRIPQPGDRILINKYSGESPRAGDMEDLYRLCNDKDIVAIME